MFFASDNWAGAAPEIVTAVVRAFSEPPVPSYGRDPSTARAEALLSHVFEREVAAFLLTSGTAANALSVAHLTPPWGAVYGHAFAHTLSSECGAPEFYSGAKLVPLGGPGAKITPGGIAVAVASARRGDPHSVQPATVTITNLTECGTLYTPAEVAAIGALCRAEGLALHMDGARFANAIVASGATPAEMTWKAGVDVLSLGATKNGAMAAEAVVFFDPARAADFLYRRMRGGHLLSKMRLVSAQFEAWFDDGLWLKLAGHANAMAARLSGRLAAKGVRLAWPTQGNEVFPILSVEAAARLRAGGAAFHDWGAPDLAPEPPVPSGHSVARLVCSYATTAEEVDAFVKAA
jgi:threonine aldolase